MFGLQLTAVIAETDEDAAAMLFQRLRKTQGFMRRVLGAAEVPYEAVIAWSLADLPAFRSICFHRLDYCLNDHMLAVEVLAATSSGKQNILLEYMRSQQDHGEPAALCRALMVAGFSEPSEDASQLITRYSDADLFVGIAARAALSAYQRNSWSIEWYRRMQSASNPIEFWRNAILFTRIVDGRFATWEVSVPPAEIFEAFRVTVNERVRDRIGRWRKKRSNTLYGGRAPDRIFIEPDYNLAQA